MRGSKARKGLIELRQSLKEDGLQTEIYYVYALVDPRDEEPFYFGKGKDDRPEKHLYEWRRGNFGEGQNLAKLRRIGAIYDAGLEVSIRIVAANLKESVAFEIEAAYIHKYRDTLTNIVSAQPPRPGRVVFSTPPEWTVYVQRPRTAPLCLWARAHQRVQEMLDSLRRPKQWKWAYVRAYGYLPDDQDWEGYFSYYQEMLRLREHFRMKALEAHAERQKA